MPYREKGGKWRGVVKYQGKRITRSFQLKGAAIDWEASERKRLKQAATLTVYLIDAATNYLDLCQAKFTSKTYDDKKRVLKEMVQIFGNIAVSEISSGDILNEIILKKSTNNLANRTRKDLHAFFEYCRNYHNLTVNPMAVIDKLPHTPALQPTPTKDEVVKLLLAANAHERNLLIVAVTTGARRSELFRLTWDDDIYFNKRLVRLGTRKTRTGGMRFRFVPMNDTCFDALKRQFKTRLSHNDFVFQNRDKRSRHYGQPYKWRRTYMKNLCKRADVRPYGFHALRRFFSSMIVDEYRRSIPTAQNLLGHMRPSTTDKYIFNITDDARSAVADLDNLFKGLTTFDKPSSKHHLRLVK